MDSIFGIIGLIIFWVVSGLLDKKRKQEAKERAARQGQEAPEELVVAPERSDEMEQALAEIRQALGMGRPASEPSAPPPVRTPEPKSPRPASAPQTSSATRSADAPAQRQKASDEFHRVVTGRPDSESEFERRKSEWTTPVKPQTPWPERKVLSRATPSEERFERSMGEFRDPLKGHDHVKKPTVVSPTKAKKNRRRLRSPKEIQEAIITAEILGPPLALRKKR